jgi:hypothetical protein
MTVMGIEDSLRRTYDAFFLSVGALQQDTGNYSLPVPLPEKPLELVKRNNRLRTRKRRAFKRHIADCAYAVVAGRCETESAAPIFASDFFATSEISPQTNVHMRPSSAEEPSIPAFPNL